MANSSKLHFPTMTVPEFRSFVTTVASYGGIKLESICEPHDVKIPLVQKLSLMAIGMPSKSPLGMPWKNMGHIKKKIRSEKLQFVRISLPENYVYHSKISGHSLLPVGMLPPKSLL